MERTESNTDSLVLCPNKIRIKTCPSAKALFNCSPLSLEKGEKLVIIMSTLRWIIKINTPNFNSQSIVGLSNIKQQCLLTVAYTRLRCLKCHSVGSSERQSLLRICAILVSVQIQLRKCSIMLPKNCPGWFPCTLKQ